MARELLQRLRAAFFVAMFFSLVMRCNAFQRPGCSFRLARTFRQVVFVFHGVTQRWEKQWTLVIGFVKVREVLVGIRRKKTLTWHFEEVADAPKFLCRERPVAV